MKVKKKVMTLATMTAASSELTELLGSYSNLPQTKSISAYKKVIKVVTDKKSVSDSKKIIKNLEKLKTFYLNSTDKTSSVLKEANQDKAVVKHNLGQINMLFASINDLFDDSENDVCIDDDNMLSFMSNMKKAKHMLEYLNDFLECAIGTLNSFNEKFVLYTYEKESGFIAAA